MPNFSSVFAKCRWWRLERPSWPFDLGTSCSWLRMRAIFNHVSGGLAARCFWSGFVKGESINKKWSHEVQTHHIWRTYRKVLNYILFISLYYILKNNAQLSQIIYRFKFHHPNIPKAKKQNQTTFTWRSWVAQSVTGSPQSPSCSSPEYEMLVICAPVGNHCLQKDTSAPSARTLVEFTHGTSRITEESTDGQWEAILL